MNFGSWHPLSTWRQRQRQIQRQRQRQNAEKAQHMLFFWKAGGSRISNFTFWPVNWSTFRWSTRPAQTRPDQTKEDQGRPQSRGPNDRTGVLVNVVQCQTLYCCIMQLIDHNHPTHSIQFKHTVSLRAQSIPEKVKNSRPINMGFKGWGRLL